MKSVNIAELKNRLSVYLNDVKAGEEILVRDRNELVARIVPLARSGDEEEELTSLAAPRTVLQAATASATPRMSTVVTFWSIRILPSDGIW